MFIYLLRETKVMNFTQKTNLGILFILVIFLTGCEFFNSATGQVVNGPYKNTMVATAYKINEANLPRFDPNATVNTENVLAFIEASNRLTAITNANSEFHIPEITTSTEKIDKFVNNADFVLQYASIIKPYNDVVDRAKEIDPNNETSINQFTYAISFLVFDVAVLNAKMSEKTLVILGESAWNVALVKNVISKENFIALAHYLGSETDEFILNHIVPFLQEQFEQT